MKLPNYLEVDLELRIEEHCCQSAKVRDMSMLPEDLLVYVSPLFP